MSIVTDSDEGAKYEKLVGSLKEHCGLEDAKRRIRELLNRHYSLPSHDNHHIYRPDGTLFAVFEPGENAPNPTP